MPTLPERETVSRKTKSYLYSVLHNEANYLHRAKAQSSIIASRITNATRANQRCLEVTRPVLSFIARFKPRIQKSYGLLFLVGGMMSLKLRQKFSIENL